MGLDHKDSALVRWPFPLGLLSLVVDIIRLDRDRHTHTHACIRVMLWLCGAPWTHSQTQTHMYAYMCMYTQKVHAHIHIHFDVHTNTYALQKFLTDSYRQSVCEICIYIHVDYKEKKETYYRGKKDLKQRQKRLHPRVARAPRWPHDSGPCGENGARADAGARRSARAPFFKRSMLPRGRFWRAYNT